jgi:hypothetical protein
MRGLASPTPGFYYVMAASQPSTSQVLEVGCTYKIIINNQEYICVAEKDPVGEVCLGDSRYSYNMVPHDNYDIMSTFVWDKGYPFCFSGNN